MPQTVWEALGISEQDFRDCIEDAIHIIGVENRMDSIVKHFCERYDEAATEIEEKKTMMTAILFGDIHGQARRRELAQQGVSDLDEDTEEMKASIIPEKNGVN